MIVVLGFILMLLSLHAMVTITNELKTGWLKLVIWCFSVSFGLTALTSITQANGVMASPIFVLISITTAIAGMTIIIAKMTKRSIKNGNS
jgi:hypothetical protein